MKDELLDKLLLELNPSGKEGGLVWLVTKEAYITGRIVSFEIFKKAFSAENKTLQSLVTSQQKELGKTKRHVFLISATMLSHGQKLEEIRAIHVPVEQIKLWGIPPKETHTFTSSTVISSSELDL